MKNLMRIAVSSLIISVILSCVTFQNSCKELNSDVLRIHIIPNSDSAFDQSVKLAVRDAVLESITPLYNEVGSKEEALEITRSNLGLIKNAAMDAAAQRKGDTNITAEIMNLYFDTRYYDDFTMPAGRYDALEIVIGEGKGSNFWCVMYPALCVGAAAKKEMKDDLSDGEYAVVTSEDVEFRFKIVEYYEKIRSFFSGI